MMSPKRMAAMGSDDIDLRILPEFDAKETDDNAIMGIRKSAFQQTATRRTSSVAMRTRKFHYKTSPTSPRRASIECGNAMLLLLLISCAFTTITTTTFVEASSLPFLSISTTPSILRNDSSLSRGILDTRAGSSASFVGPASGGLAFESLSYYLRVALAGGVAGATGSAVLYPIDSAKTLRQSDPSAYSSVKDALFKMLKSKHAIQRVYKGILPAALGAIPSSALYFGAYESSKVTLQKIMGGENHASETGYRKRMLIHGLAAASGNVLSSFVFVPKEVIKQQLQTKSSASIKSIVQQKGIAGLYAGYGATLLRNIPSATIRFVLYEELKRKWAMAKKDEDERTQKLRAVGTFLAGAVAGSTSSFVMTPVDVVKTRLATGSCPLGVKNCMLHVVKEVGWKGLYAGAGSRVLWSGAFSAIGFGTFEIVKGYLGVANSSIMSSTNASTRTSMPTKTLAKSTIRTR